MDTLFIHFIHSAEFETVVELRALKNFTEHGVRLPIQQSEVSVGERYECPNDIL